jgi:ribosomal protein S20
MLAVVCAVFVFGTIATGFAEQGDWRGGIRSRIQESKQKIEQGIERGSLNRLEADRLHSELGAILNKIDRMKADGYLSQGERDTIKSDLDRLDRDIFKEKHDAVTAVPAVQQDWRGGIRTRIQDSKQKIDQGINQGTLNRREADRLNAELGAILNKIDRMKADGHLSQGERDNLKNDLDRLDRDIFKEKHDAVTAVPVVLQDWRGGTRTRIQDSKQKIVQGVERGTLNRNEARKLNKELGKILYKIDRMKADGRISPREREKINRDLDRLDRDIFKEKRN